MDSIPHVMARTIPQPRPIPIIGNLFDVDGDAPIQSLMPLAVRCGPIFKITILGYTMIWLSSQELVSEVCDETRFSKQVHNSLLELRALAGDGLFTAFGTEPNWARAHRLLMPAFGPLGVRGMFARMLDIAEQMMVRWERFGDAAFDLADNMTRLTLDTLALCALDYRFNSFYRDQLHPFVAAMNGSLSEAAARERRPPFVSNAMIRTRRRYEADVKTMHDLADGLLAARRRETGGPTRGDLLDKMLHGRDPVTGEGLSDENIRNQLVTFLIAGHETTSGLLSFAVFLLLRNPEALRKARACVDEALGTATPTVDDLARLRYVEQILMETLRLWPTAPAFAVTPHDPTTIGGCYEVVPGDEILVLLPSLHRDRKVWGEDADAFRPERFAPGAAEALPPHAWKPFGNGQRACIGRGFAMQEAQLVLTMLLQRFDLSLADPTYVLKVHESLTMKPKGLMVRARRREPAGPTPHPGPFEKAAPARPEAGWAGPATPLLVLYGGNSGSSEAFAGTLARRSADQGYHPTLASLDAFAGKLPSEGAVIIITASYEGLPPDNARRFMSWLAGLAPGSLDGVRYAVFGCGNRQWARTYQAVPTQADDGLRAAGATRLRARGETDASGDFTGGFEAWCDGLWPDLAAALGREPPASANRTTLDVDVLPPTRQALLGQPDLQAGSVLENRELVDMTSSIARSKRHLGIRLPPGMTFRAGDYLAVLPHNPAAAVARALRVFGLPGDAQVMVRGATSLPADRQTSLAEILGAYVELGQPATRRQVGELAAIAPSATERAALLALAEPEAYDAEVAARRVSLLDLLDRHPATRPSLGQFLGWLPPTRIRQYSISSSPLVEASECSLTVAVLDEPALSGEARHRGVATTYLAQLAPGDAITVAVRPARTGFHLPPPATPIVMVCAGSGIAPFRGFLQERSVLLAKGESLGPALLFFGCMHPDVDWLYREELLDWQAQGIVDLRMAFSRERADLRCRVQDRLWRDRREVAEMFVEGAHVYVCGRADTMVKAVRSTFVDILVRQTGEGPAGDPVAAAALEATGRYMVDAFA